MSEAAGAHEMTVAFQVAYDGPADVHSMDVHALGPALIAFGNLVRETNQEINGDRSKVRLLVKTDFEHKCFNIYFELAQSLTDQLLGFIRSDGVKDATEILERLGILGGTGVGLFKLLAWLRGRQNQVTEIKDETKGGIVILQIGEGADIEKIEVSADTYRLTKNAKVLRAAEQVLAPIDDSSTYDKLEFRSGSEVTAKIEKEEAERIKLACAVKPQMEAATDEPQTVTAYLRVYSSVFDDKAANWRFLYGEQHIYADISETTISKDAISRGWVGIGDTYKVRMEIRQKKNSSGEYTNSYKIKKVLEFTPAPQQLPFPDENEK